MASSDSRPGPAPEQPDMFGAPAPKAYIPDPRHVRNRLQSLLSQMRDSETWPWSPVMVRLHRERTFDYLCGHLPDRAEAADWRAALDAEIARLEAADAA
ncbi:MAG: hypothetical protein ACE5FO_14005 [Parvularculaceae bacterium]